MPVAVAAVLLSAVVVLSYLLPGVDRFGMLLATVCIAGIAAAVYSRCDSRSTAGWYTLAAALTLSMAGTIVSVWYFTTASGGTLENPVLNNFDAARDWAWGCHYAFGDDVPPEYYATGGGYRVAACLAVLGRSVASPIFLNVLCYVLAVIAVGCVAWKSTGDRRTATAAMIITASMGYLLAQSTVIIKDVPVTLLMACTAYVFVCRANGAANASLKITHTVMLVSALLLLGILRHNILFMVALGAVIFAVRRGGIDWPLIGVAIIAVAVRSAMLQWALPPTGTAMQVVTAESSAEIILTNPYTMGYDSMLGDYTTMPFYRKLLWLPASVVVQFLIPFPWNWTRDVIFSPVQAVAHCGYMWYAAGALILYWIGSSRRRESSVALRRLVLWGVLLTVLTAYISSGRVSRYCLPYLPMLLPAAADVVVSACAARGVRRSLTLWLGIFAAALAVTLIICHSLQSSFL